MKRRQFLKTTSVLAATSLLMIRPTLAAKNKLIGVQLYTVRNEINNDLIGTLKQVAEIGYNTVELAGYKEGLFYGKSPNEFKKIAKDVGLKVLSSHNGMDPKSVEKVVEDNAQLGVKYTVVPSFGNTPRETLDDYKKQADLFNSYGETCKKAGIQFAYHNHAFEFEMKDGKIPYDVLLENTDPKLVKFEMDLYWIKKAGYEPVDYFQKYPGRFALWHVKDQDPQSGKYTEVGKGDIDFKEIFNHASESGMKYFFVELDNSEKPALDSIKISFDYLNKAAFVR